MSKPLTPKRAGLILCAEVVSLFKKSLLLLAALLLTLGANLRPCWDYGSLAPACGLRTAARAERAARAAAEELLPGAAAQPAAARRLRLRLRRPEGDARLLSDALLRATPGVALRDEVRLNGARLGWVADGESLRAALDAYVQNTLPTWAVGGRLSGELRLRRLYTRDGPVSAERDMLLRITGAAPVFYYDATGRSARA